MEQFSIGNNEIKVNYISELPLINYYLENKEKMEFYNYSIMQYDANYPTVIYKNSDNIDIQVDSNIMRIECPINIVSESNILYMGQKFLERQNLENSKISCHSACVEKDGKAVLLIGEAGAGKTSLAINLCMQHGYNLISNDMTLIGNNDGMLYAYEGTKFLNLRLESVNNNMPQLKFLFENCKKNEWLYKKCMMPHDIGILEARGSFPIVNVFFIHVGNRMNCELSPGDTWRNNFIIYQNLTSHISNQSSSFVDKKGHNIGYVPSFDTKELYENRIKIIDLINDNSYNLCGNLQDCMNVINNKMMEKETVRKYGKR
ncbi:MAG: hypothetical protein PUD07_00020 [bacterium]|nr:hypothetical protein [bacterium]